MIDETRSVDALDVAHEVTDALNKLRMGATESAMDDLERLRDSLIASAQRKRTKDAPTGAAGLVGGAA